MVFSKTQLILIALKWSDSLDFQEIGSYLNIDKPKAKALVRHLQDKKFIDEIPLINSFKLTKEGLKWANFFNEGYEVFYNCKVVDHLKKGKLINQ